MRTKDRHQLIPFNFLRINLNYIHFCSTILHWYNNNYDDNNNNNYDVIIIKQKIKDKSIVIDYLDYTILRYKLWDIKFSKKYSKAFAKKFYFN